MKALHRTWPTARVRLHLRRRVENAYRDASFFYQITEPNRPLYRRMAKARDRIRNNNRLRLALFHPLKLPTEIDFLNLGGREWRHPCYGERRSSASFPQLFERALAEAVPAVRAVHEALGAREGAAGGDPAALAALAGLIGNASLDTAEEDGGRCVPLHCDPLPLPEMIERLYVVDCGPAFVDSRGKLRV